MRPVLISFMALGAFAACNGTTPTTNDASTDASTLDEPDVIDAAEEWSPVMHAAITPMPFGGGRVLAQADVVVVTFAGYSLADDVESMADWLPTSKWLTAVGAEYGVALHSVTKVRLTSFAPSFTSAPAFTSFVASQVGTTVPSPPSASTFYAFVFPDGESFTDPDIGTLCTSFTGYHDAAAASAYTFAAIGTCPKHVPVLDDFEQVERVLSHELIEALTDPFGDGWVSRSPDDPWSYVSGGEVADVCNGYAHEETFLAVRSWSNAAAALNDDPCEPNDVPAPFFDADVASLTTIAAGSAATIAIEAWSNAATSDWLITPVVGNTTAFVPIVTFKPGAINSGTMTSMTVAIPSSAASGGTVAIFLHSLHAGDTTYALAPLLVRAQ